MKALSKPPEDALLDTKIELLRLLADGAEYGINWYTPSDDRFAELVARLAVTDDPWILRCIAWLAPSTRWHRPPSSPPPNSSGPACARKRPPGEPTAESWR